MYFFSCFLSRRSHRESACVSAVDAARCATLRPYGLARVPLADTLLPRAVVRDLWRRRVQRGGRRPSLPLLWPRSLPGLPRRAAAGTEGSRLRRKPRRPSPRRIRAPVAATAVTGAASAAVARQPAELSFPPPASAAASAVAAVAACAAADPISASAAALPAAAGRAPAVPNPVWSAAVRAAAAGRALAARRRAGRAAPRLRRGDGDVRERVRRRGRRRCAPHAGLTLLWEPLI